MILAVLGGDSVSTPVLLREIAAAAHVHDHLAGIEVRLLGRNQARLRGISEYAERRCSGIDVSVHTEVRAAARHASHILCQIRPGGMHGRADDERLALKHGTPADEGLGLGGVLAYLRGRKIISPLLAECAAVAGSAQVLMMTAPLGPMTWLANEHFPGKAVGLCELPDVTARKVYAKASAHGVDVETHVAAGVNHCSWLYNLQDSAGRDVTLDVLRCLQTRDIGVDRAIAQACSAVPMHYLRLFLETDKVILEQQTKSETRGEQLIRWREELDVLLSESGSSARLVEQKLCERNMEWYRDGVIPLLEAMAGCTDRRMVLNVPNERLIPGISPQAIVEATVALSKHGISRTPLPALPERPRALTRKLVEFERRLTALPSEASAARLSDVLAAHPLLAGLPLPAVSAAVRDRLEQPRSLRALGHNPVPT